MSRCQGPEAEKKLRPQGISWPAWLEPERCGEMAENKGAREAGARSDPMGALEEVVFYSKRNEKQ